MTGQQSLKSEHRLESQAALAAAIVGIPFDLGAPRRGSGLATRAIRYAGLEKRLKKLGLSVKDLGDILVPDIPAPHSDLLRNLPAVAEAAEAAYHGAREAIMQGAVGVFLGGDHSVAIGTIAGVASAHAARGERLGILWFDAHGDFNTADTTVSGHIHGMPFAVALGHGVPELTHLGGFSPKVRSENAVLIGARDLDDEEERLMVASGITVYRMREIERRGIEAVMKEAIAIASNGTAGLHVSFDLDALDPKEAPGVGSPSRHGMSAREARVALGMVAETGLMRSIDMVEVDPLLDSRNESAKLAVDLIAAAFTR
ncbi:arginase [bacterium]|nr:arginase [bacterium]